MGVAPAPAGAGATVGARYRSGFLGFRGSLLDDPEVSAPELGVDHGADDRAEAVGEAGQVADLQLRPRLVGREAVARVGEPERVAEVRVRAVDARGLAGREERERVCERAPDHSRSA